jgi:acetyl esterase/lipase
MKFPARLRINKKHMRNRIILTAVLCCIFSLESLQAQYSTKKNIPYYPDAKSQADAYVAERCLLDLYYPENEDGFATIIWFHGGGLKGGQKEIPGALKDKGVAVVGVNYRLYPKVGAPAYIEDAAAAVAWVFGNIAPYGGDPALIFVSGHSAGGYLTSMVGLDKRWLAAHQVDANDIAGLIPFSGHTITHFTVREERGIEGTQPVVDELAPLYHVRADAPPLLLITGDREKEMLGRYEENAYMMRMMKVAGHKETRLYELDGYGHGMTGPAFPLLLEEVHRIMDMKLQDP